MNIKTWQEVSKQFTVDRRAMATNQMIWMQQEIDELRAAYEAQAKRIAELEEHVTKLGSGSRQHLYQAFARRYREILSLRRENEAQAKKIAELEKGLTEISEWTKRYTSTGHPISTVADRLLSVSKNQDICTDGGKCGAGGYCKDCNAKGGEKP